MSLEEQLLNVATVGDTDAIAALLQAGANINAKNQFNETPLLLAIRYNPSMAVIRFLIEQGADITVKDSNHHTALQLAIFYRREQQPELIELLVHHGLTFDGPDFKAAYYGNLDDSNFRLYHILYDEEDYGCLNSSIARRKHFNIQDSCGYNLLHYACANHQVPMMDWLRKNISLSKKTSKLKRTALHLAALNYKENTIKWLVEYQADINSVDDQNNKPLDYLPKTASLEIICLLATYPLHAICKSGHLTALKELVALGYDINQLDPETELTPTPLCVALAYKQLEVANYLLTHQHINFEAHSQGKLALLIAVKNGMLEVVDWLLIQGKVTLADREDIEGEGSEYTALLLAARYGHHTLVDHLWTKRGADIRERLASGETAFLLAAEHGHFETLKWLYENGGSQLDECDNYQFNACHKASENGHYDIVVWLIHIMPALIYQKAGWNGMTPLMNAAATGHLALVELFLERDKRNNQEKLSEYGWAAIAAIYHNHPEIVKRLLTANKLIINYKDNENNDVFMFAASEGRLEILHWLMAHFTADMQARNNAGKTLFLGAAAGGHTEVVCWLLTQGNANSQDRDREGRTALLLAAQEDHLMTVQWFLQNGYANIWEVDQSKHSIFEIDTYEVKKWLSAEYLRQSDVARGLWYGEKSRLDYDLSHSPMNQKGAICLAEALQDPRCRPHIKLNLTNSLVGIDTFQIFSSMLSSGRCVPWLTLNLSHNGLGQQAIGMLAEALESGNCPQGLQLRLARNAIDLEVIGLLARAIASGHCPAKLYLDLSGNNLHLDCIELLAQAVLSGLCPPELTLDLSENPLGKEGLAVLTNLSNHPLTPRGFQLLFRCESLREGFYRGIALQQGKHQPGTLVYSLPQEIMEAIYQYINPYYPDDVRAVNFSSYLSEVLTKLNNTFYRHRVECFITEYQNEQASLSKKELDNPYTVTASVLPLTEAFITNILLLLARDNQTGTDCHLENCINMFVENWIKNQPEINRLVLLLVKYRLTNTQNNDKLHSVLMLNSMAENNPSSSKKRKYFNGLFFNNLDHLTRLESNENNERTVKRQALGMK